MKRWENVNNPFLSETAADYMTAKAHSCPKCDREVTMKDVGAMREIV